MLNVLDSHTHVTPFAQEAERRRIARKLHDSAVQSLTALIADLEYFRTRHLPATDETRKAWLISMKYNLSDVECIFNS